MGFNANCLGFGSFPGTGGGGGSQTLAQTLVYGNVTGGTSIVLSTTDKIKSANSFVNINFNTGIIGQFYYDNGAGISGYVNVGSASTQLIHTELGVTTSILVGYQAIQLNASEIHIGNGSDITGYQKWYNSTNSNYVGVKSGITTVSYDVILPTAQSVGVKFLQNDGSGILSWATAGSSTPSLSAVLAVGDSTGNNNIIWQPTYNAKFQNADGDFTTDLSNNQVTTANRTVYLPQFSGQLTYKNTTLNTNYVLKSTANQEIVSSSLIYDNGTNVGIGTNSPTQKIELLGTTQNTYFKIKNTNAGSDGFGLFLADLSDNFVGGLAYGNTLQYLNNFALVSASGSNLLLATDATASTGGTTPIKFNIGGYGSGAEKMRLTSTGLSIGLTTNSATVHVKGSTSDSSAYSLKVDNSSSTPLLYVRNDGLIMAGSSTPTSRFYFKDLNNTSSQDAMQVESNYSSNAYNSNYSHYSALNTSAVVGNVTRVLGMSNTTSYDLACLFFQEKSAGVGSLHLTSRGSSIQNLGIKVFADGYVAMPNIPVGNGGLASGDLYVDTAANVLANGDYIVARKV